MTQDPLTAARELHDTIVASRTEIESERCLTDPVVQAIRDSGLSRLALEEELGGAAVDGHEWLRVYEELARTEASVAWIVWNCALPCLFGRHLADDPRAALLGGAARMYASSTRPSGKAEAVDGGFRVSGRWSLVSGCMHADTICFMCLVTDGGELRTVDGAPVMRLMYVRREECEIIDTWHVGGLRGTGSHDIVLEDHAVPADNSCSPFEPSNVGGALGNIPIASTMSAGHAALCLGIAQGALDDVVELARTKVTVDPAPGLRDRPSNQRAVAEISSELAARRRQLHVAMKAVWDNAAAGSAGSAEQIADLWGAAIGAGLAARDAVTTMYAVAGSPALYVDSALERRHRDVHAAMQHIVAQPLWLEQAGMVRLGLEPTHPLFAV